MHLWGGRPCPADLYWGCKPCLSNPVCSITVPNQFSADYRLHGHCLDTHGFRPEGNFKDRTVCGVCVGVFRNPPHGQEFYTCVPLLFSLPPTPSRVFNTGVGGGGRIKSGPPFRPTGSRAVQNPNVSVDSSMCVNSHMSWQGPSAVLKLFWGVENLMLLSA